MRVLGLVVYISLVVSVGFAEEPIFESELVFPLEHWHNHSSSIVEMPGGGFFLVWFHGSGERRSDDVVIQASRLLPGADKWTKPFTIADVPNYPDTNSMVFVDSRKRLWLFWPTILANEWHTALMNFKVSSNFEQSEGPPDWDREGNILLKHDLERFSAKVRSVAGPALAEATKPEQVEYLKHIIDKADDKYFSRLGWMTRTHPLELPSGRILLPLYSDGYSFGLVAISDDAGETWRPSEPIVGFGSIQPSLVRKRDGTIVAFMRDNGPPPKRVHTAFSKDDGETWSEVTDTKIPNPGSSVEAIALKDRRWLFVGNDLEKGRHRLVAMLSDNEGASWKWKRYIEKHEPREIHAHYPSVIQASDGSIHVTYSYFLENRPRDSDRKAIKHARFNAAWIEAGEL